MKSKIRKMLAEHGYKLRNIVLADEYSGDYQCFGYCTKIDGDETVYGFTAAETSLEWLVEVLAAKEEFRQKK